MRKCCSVRVRHTGTDDLMQSSSSPYFPIFCLYLSLSVSVSFFLSLSFLSFFLSLFVVVVCVSSPTTAEITSSLSCFPVSLCSSFYSSSFVWREAETVDLIRFTPVIQSCRKVREHCILYYVGGLRAFRAEDSAS